MADDCLARSSLYEKRKITRKSQARVLCSTGDSTSLFELSQDSESASLCLEVHCQVKLTVYGCEQGTGQG